MERILDLLSLTAAALAELARREPRRFVVLLGFALLSAGLSWVLLTHSALLWNKSFAPKAARHPLCALTALFTLCAVALSVGVLGTRSLVDRAVAKWARESLASPQWRDAAIEGAAETIRRRGLEPLPPPPMAHWLPMTTTAAREAAAAAYSAAAVASFSRASPRLSSLLEPSTEITARALAEDMKRFFDSSTGLYPTSRVEEIISGCWRQMTERRWGEVVLRLQTRLLLLLLILHLVVFGIVGWSGYREIRPRDGAGDRWRKKGRILSIAASLSQGAALFLWLGSRLNSVRAGPLPVTLLSDNAYAQLVPGTPTSLPTPSARLVPHVRYQEEIVLENGDRTTKLRFYSEEDPASPPTWFRVWENGQPTQPVRGTAPAEMVHLGERKGNPVFHAWMIPVVFAPREAKRIRIEAEYPVHPASDHPGHDHFETYFSFWGWQPSRPDLLFRFDLEPMIAAIPCLGRSPTPALAPWLFSSWFTIRPAGYEPHGFTVWWRFRDSTAERCERISVEWPAWYR